MRRGLQHHLSGEGPAIHILEASRVQRLRRNARIRYRDKSAGVERRQIVVRRRFDVMSELRRHLDDHLTLLPFRADGFLSAIERVRHQRVEEINGRFERGHVDGWTGECRITGHAVADGIQPLQQIGIRHAAESEHCFYLLYLVTNCRCHRDTSFF